MKALLLKTKKLAEKYIRENYPNSHLRDSSISDRSEYETERGYYPQWSGETPAWEVEDENGKTLAIVAWWEEGDDKYELYVGDKLVSAFDNIYDAREAYGKAVEAEEYDDEPKDVKLFCNNEDMGL